MPYLSPPPSTSARSVCLSLNTIQVQITGARLTKQVQQTLLRRAQQALLRQAQQALPNWPNIYKFAMSKSMFFILSFITHEIVCYDRISLFKGSSGTL